MVEGPGRHVHLFQVQLAEEIAEFNAATGKEMKELLGRVTEAEITWRRTHAAVCFTYVGNRHQLAPSESSRFSIPKFRRRASQGPVLVKLKRPGLQREYTRTLCCGHADRHVFFSLSLRCCGRA